MYIPEDSINDGLQMGKSFDEGMAFELNDSTWDTDNECFVSCPTMVTTKTGYSGAAPAESTCFKITWEADKPKVQRTFHHVSVDNEGMQLGTMTVHVPYFTAGPQLANQLHALCLDDDLRDVIVGSECV